MMGMRPMNLLYWNPWRFPDADWSPELGTQDTPSPPEPSPKDRMAIIHLKGTREYTSWLEDFYKQSYTPKASLVRLGLAELARVRGFRPPPEF